MTFVLKIFVNLCFQNDTMSHTNIATLLKAVFEKYSKKILLRIHREGNWVNFSGKQCNDLIEKIASSLLNEGVEHNENISIFSQNMPEWTLADIASISIGCPIVPIYATNVSEQVQYVLNDANIKIIFVGEQEQYEEVLSCINKGYGSLRKIIVFDKAVELKNEISIHLDDWLEQNLSQDFSEELISRRKKIMKTDVATIIYTSGTTGKPKGVILTHQNFLFQIESHKERYHFKDTDSSLAFLPLSHVFERAWTFLILSVGMLNTYNKDPRTIAEAIQLAQPTAMCSVPRLYEKIYHLAIDTMKNASAPVKNLFFWAVKIGTQREEYIRKHKKIPTLLKVKDTVAEKLVFKKFRKKLGGKLSFMPCGGAYLSDEVLNFFRAMRLPIILGYGLSETTATVTAGLKEDYTLGTVGKPLKNIQIKIGENDEILIKGDNVTKGYYNCPEENEKVFTEDGWFRTGDAGKIDTDGNLIITDRIKELIKTAGGKYIAPQLVENALTNDPFIDQAVVYGERKPYAVALIAPNFETLKKWANEQKINYNNLTNLVQNNSVVEMFNAKVKELQAKLARYEQVKKFHLLDKELSMKNGEITPTLKPIRKAIFAKYKKFLEDLYKK